MIFTANPPPVPSRTRPCVALSNKPAGAARRQRAAVFAYLHAAQVHPTAEQAFAAVRQQIPNISLATVYKALEALVDAHLANRIAGDTGPTRYDGRSEPHYHLRCQRTGKVIDLPLPYDPNLLDKLDPQLIETLRQQGFEITGHRLELVGRFLSPAEK